MKLNFPKSPLPKKDFVAFAISAVAAVCVFMNGCTGTAINPSAITTVTSELTAAVIPNLEAAAQIYAAYKGQSIPNSSIDTGSAKVDSILQSANTGAAVGASDIALIQKIIGQIQTTGTTAMRIHINPIRVIVMRKKGNTLYVKVISTEHANGFNSTAWLLFKR